MSSETLPIVGKRYNAFNDGKIRPSRKCEVVIKELISFGEAEDVLIAFWNQISNECDWLYATETDYFAKAAASLYISGNVSLCFFARSVNGGWYGIDENLRLDIDGSLSASIGLPPFPA